MNRREALARLAALAAAGTSGIAAHAQTTSTVAANTAANILPASTGKPLVIAHITDTHITDSYHSDKWVAECFKKIQNHPLKPQIILHTGDVIYDSLRLDSAKAAERLWKIWQTTVQRESSLPVKIALGNHDHLGGKLPADNPVHQDPMQGKALAKDVLGLDKTWYSFEIGDWSVIMLDSIFQMTVDGQSDWIAKLDDEQAQWLKSTLKQIPEHRPVLVGSHVPVAQASHMLHQKPTPEGTYSVGPRNIMTDARSIIDLFRKHPNVKLCLSGHTHSRDRLTLENATYINAGSVCGSQWRVENQSEQKPGYSIVTLHPDGNFDYTYENYGWKWIPA